MHKIVDRVDIGGGVERGVEDEGVRAATADQQVVARAAVDHVVSGVTLHGVIAGIAKQMILGAATAKRVVLVSPVQPVAAPVAAKLVGPIPAE